MKTNLFCIVIRFNQGDEISKTELIKDRVRNYKDEFVKTLEHRKIDFLLSQLSKSKTFHDRDIEFIKKDHNSYERIKRLLSLVENGSPDSVDGFVTAIKDLGYLDILELIDPPFVHIKAGKYIYNKRYHVSNVKHLNFIYTCKSPTLMFSLDIYYYNDNKPKQCNNSQTDIYPLIVNNVDLHKEQGNSRYWSSIYIYCTSVTIAQTRCSFYYRKN